MMQFKSGTFKIEMTQTQFVEWLGYAQADKHQTSASVRSAAIFWAEQDGAVFTDETLDAIVREYEATYGVHLEGLAG
jgi:ATP-dependent protease HslVU (ClpYQ) ATPase subunit